MQERSHGFGIVSGQSEICVDLGVRHILRKDSRSATQRCDFRTESLRLKRGIVGGAQATSLIICTLHTLSPQDR